jgi:hypothetical protein
VTLAIVDPLPIVRAIRAAADVIDVDEGHGFCASVLVTPGGTAVVRLDRSLEGSPHEGTVLRWTMLRTTGSFGPGYFVYRIADAIAPEGD